MGRFSIALAGVLLALTLAACGVQSSADQASQLVQPSPSAADVATGDVDALMAEAKSLAEENYELEGSLWEQGVMMEVITAPDLKALEPVLARCRKILARERANEQAIAALLDQVIGRDVSKELTTYAGQQKEIARLQSLALGPQEDFLEKIESVYREKGKLSQAEMEKLLMNAWGRSGPDDPLAGLEEKGHASQAYFRQSGLPERYYINNGFGGANATSTGTAQFPMAPSIWYDFQGPTSDGVDPEASEDTPSFVGVEEYPWETRGSFDEPVAEAMRDQQDVLERSGWSVEAQSSADGGTMTARKENFQAELTFHAAEAGTGRRGTVVIRVTAL